MSKDYQNAFENSQLDISELRRVLNKAIQAELVKGKFVVVYKTIAHCPLTDAVLNGYSNYLIESFDTREEAEEAWENSYKSELDDAESHYVVLPERKTRACDKCKKEVETVVGVDRDDFTTIYNTEIVRYVCKDCVRG